MSEQIGLFVRKHEGGPWVFEGFHSNSEDAVFMFELIELSYPDAEGIWFNPETVLNTMLTEGENDE